MFTRLAAIAAAFALGSLIPVAAGGPAVAQDEPLALAACFDTFINLPMIADTRTQRFDGKVDEAHARCRGGEAAVGQHEHPVGRLVELLGRPRDARLEVRPARHRLASSSTATSAASTARSSISNTSAWS